jgi:ABC-2 type transport system ATP-binding protein
VKRYGTRTVVDGLSFDVSPGEIFAILGPNGAGKTTTVEILEGYRQPDGGTVRVLESDPSRDATRLKPRIGIMLQNGGVYPQIGPLEALHHFASFFSQPDDPHDLLRKVGLEDVAQTRYRRLSGGEKQRLSLALALVGRPEVVFLDEPTTSMDPRARRDTWQVIQDLRGSGVTVVLTTHFMDEAERLANRVALLRAGRLVALGTPAELAHRASREVIHFGSRPGLDVVALASWLGIASVREEDPGSYVIAAQPTPALVAALSSWLAERDVLLTSLTTGAPSLEEAYLRLTQERAEVSE